MAVSGKNLAELEICLNLIKVWFISYILFNAINIYYAQASYLGSLSLLFLESVDLEP